MSIEMNRSVEESNKSPLQPDVAIQNSEKKRNVADIVLKVTAVAATALTLTSAALWTAGFPIATTAIVLAASAGLFAVHAIEVHLLGVACQKKQAVQPNVEEAKEQSDQNGLNTNNQELQDKLLDAETSLEKKEKELEDTLSQLRELTERCESLEKENSTIKNELQKKNENDVLPIENLRAARKVLSGLRAKIIRKRPLNVSVFADELSKYLNPQSSADNILGASHNDENAHLVPNTPAPTPPSSGMTIQEVNTAVLKRFKKK